MAALLDLAASRQALFWMHVGCSCFGSRLSVLSAKLRLREARGGGATGGADQLGARLVADGRPAGGKFAGAVRGRMLSKRDAVCSALPLIYLLASCCWVGPQMAHATIPAPLQSITRFGLPAVLLVCTVIAIRRPMRRRSGTGFCLQPAAVPAAGVHPALGALPPVSWR